MSQSDPAAAITPGAWYVSMKREGGRLRLRPAHRAVDATGNTSCHSRLPGRALLLRPAVEGDTLCQSCKFGRPPVKGGSQ